MWFVTLVLRNLWNRKTRSVLTCLGMGIAVCTIVTLFGIIDVYEGAVVRMYETRGVDVVATRAGVAQVMLGRLNQDLGDRLRKLGGVRSVEPMLLDLISFKDPRLEAVYVFGWDPAGTLFQDLTFNSGRSLEPGDQNRLILGASLARSLNKTIGQKVLIEETELEIVGIYDSGNLLQDNSAILSLPVLQELMQQQGKVTVFLLRIEDGPDKKARIESLCRQIEEIKDDKGRTLMSANPTQEHVRGSLELRVIKAMSFATSFIALFIGVIGMLNTMMISVFERTREIGTLRAVGWPRWRVVAMIIQETLLLAACGALLGLAMSIALTWFLHHVVQDSALKIPIFPTLSVVAMAVLLAVGVGLVGALYPAYRASHLLPTEALRHD